MKKLIAPVLFAATIGMPFALPPTAFSDDVTIEKKTTTTSPSGRFVIESESTRSFRIDGQPKIYVAPADIDLREYTGKDVSISLDPTGRVTRIEKRTTTTVD